MKIKIIKIFWIVLGCIFTAIGFLGIVLPILPVIPFLLLASACFLRGSPKIHKMFTNLFLRNRFYQKYLKQYINKQNEKYIKLMFIFFIAISSSFSFIFFADTHLARSGIVVMALSVSTYILLVKLVKETA